MITEFDDVVDTLVVSSTLSDLHPTFEHALTSSSSSSSAVVFDVACFTRPYNLNEEDGRGVELLRRVHESVNVKPIFVAWNVKNEDDVTSYLKTLGVDNPVVAFCSGGVSNLSWKPSLAAYIKQQVQDVAGTLDVIMYVGRTWVHVLPPDIETVSSVSTEQHLLCRHKSTGMWCFRMSPSKFLTS